MTIGPGWPVCGAGGECLASPELARQFERDGVALQRGALSAAWVKRLATSADELYRALAAGRTQGGPQTAEARVPKGEKYLPRVASFTLGSICGTSEFTALLQTLAAPPVMALLARALHGAAACNRDQAWVRRQYAPRHAPPHHALHGWHQDGALGYDFLAAAGNAGPDAPLPMVTCWIPLTTCGRLAPGLEILARRFDRVLPLPELNDEWLRARFPEESFWRPELSPGEALWLAGGTMHRTCAKPDMALDRTSVELRFFAADAIPARLAKDRFVRLA